MITSNQKETALYCRLSQDDNTENESNSIQNQKMILQRYAADHHFPNPCFYVDDGHTGANFQRPGFQQMMADMENGEIGIIITKDLSRLGRNQLHTGLYIEERFPMFGVRYIAINDNVDTDSSESNELMPFKNLFNESERTEAINTSMKAKRDRLSELKELLRLVDLYRDTKPNIRKDGDFWAPPTVKSILRNEVYLGHMVQNKTGNLSYKVHKQIAKPESEWIRVENTHEPLISRETWNLVRELDARKVKFRSSKTGETALFTGVLFCMDCKSPMRHYRDGRKRKDGSPSTYQSYACNRYVTGGKTVCSGHIINQRVLIELLLIDIRFKAALAQNQPNTLKDKIMAQKSAAGLEQRKTLQATMNALDKRLTELEKLVVAAYEDKVKGAIPEMVCVQLIKRYEDERAEKLEQRTKLSAQLEACQEDEKAADNWLTMIRDYSKLEELDRPTLLRLVKRIEVGERRTVNGHDERDIKIYYNFVGFVEL